MGEPDGLARGSTTDQIELRPIRPGKEPWTLRCEGQSFRFESPDDDRVVEIPQGEAARKLEILPTWDRPAGLKQYRRFRSL